MYEITQSFTEERDRENPPVSEGRYNRIGYPSDNTGNVETANRENTCIPMLGRGDSDSKDSQWHKTIQSEKPRLSKDSPIAVVLFSGGGGIETGMTMAGIRPAIAVEFDPTDPKLSNRLAEMHDRNFEEYGCKVIRRSVQDLARLGFPGFPRDIDFLHASPVCANFSQAKKGAEESSDDIAMAEAIAIAIAILKPKTFTLEQATKYKNSQSWGTIKAQLKNSGYIITESTVDMADYGIPQKSRKRMIVSAAKNYTPSLPISASKISWLDAIADLIPTLPASTLTNTQTLAIADQGFPVLVQRTKQRGECRISPAEAQAYTLTKSHFYDGKGGSRSHVLDIVLADGQCKQLTMQAIARLQGFPDWYDFTGGVGAAIGYSVPPLFAYQWFSHLLKKPLSVLRSPLKWAGGKTGLIDKMRSHWESSGCDRWVDLFAGSCALPLALQPSTALINDRNPHLIDFWNWIKADGIVRNFNFVNDAKYFAEARSQFNKTHDPELFYYLNRTGYNGLCRYSNSGRFNTPYGGVYKGKISQICYRTDFTEYQSLLQKWDFISTDFAAIELRDRDFVYADPPYDDGFVNYCGGFTWEQQVKLAKKLAAHEGIAIASNKATNRIVDLYQSLGFHIEIIPMGRRISCNGDRTPVNEIFAINE